MKLKFSKVAFIFSVKYTHPLHQLYFEVKHSTAAVLGQQKLEVFLPRNCCYLFITSSTITHVYSMTDKNIVMHVGLGSSTEDRAPKSFITIEPKTRVPKK